MFEDAHAFVAVVVLTFLWPPSPHCGFVQALSWCFYLSVAGRAYLYKLMGEEGFVPISTKGL
jgi:hypothetical protein